jgi:thioredoxin family protein/AhpC/TSA family protein
MSLFGLHQSGGSLGDEGRLPSFDDATEWLNSPPLKPADLRGKVAVVDFCTYTCINWLRQLPYVRAWSEKYEKRGLVVIGVHTPEFSFEHDLENVRTAIAGMRIEYPIAVDNDYAVWDAFSNHYWPALYFVDAEGHIRHHRFGEGDYDRSEMVIQRLLADAGVEGIGSELVSVDGDGPEAAADWEDLETAETYVGFRQTQGFASPGGLAADERRTYEPPDQLLRNDWALSGDWTIGAEAGHLHEPGGRIAFRFHARDVHLVMGPSSRGQSVPFRVLLDGHAPGVDRGTDIEADGSGTLEQQGLHQLIRQAGPVEDRLFEIEFLQAGVEAFAFTFG